MTVGEFKQWLIDNKVTDDAEILITDDSLNVLTVDYLPLSNIVEIT